MDSNTLAGPDPDRSLEWTLRLGSYVERAQDAQPKMVVEGMLRRTVGLAMEAEG